MSRAVVTADLIRSQARSLKMPGLARSFEAVARHAREEKWTEEEYLHEVLSVEIASRADSAVRQRIRDARFPEPKSLGEFDFDAAEGIDAAQIAELGRGNWIQRAENLIFAGPIGTGKTHLAIALGIEAARQRRRVAFFRAADLVRMLLEARDARELGRLQKRIARVELLILDELGFVPFDRSGGELLFNLIADRYEQRSVLVTSNLAFGEWPKVFAGDEKLTTALLDRLAHHAMIVTTRGKSFRMRRRQGSASKEENATALSSPEPIADASLRKAKPAKTG
jgi:DNA replication protein DnaC